MPSPLLQLRFGLALGSPKGLSSYYSWQLPTPIPCRRSSVLVGGQLSTETPTPRVLGTLADVWGKQGLIELRDLVGILIGLLKGWLHRLEADSWTLSRAGWACLGALCFSITESRCF